MDRDQRPNRPVGRGNPRFFAPPVAGNQAYRPIQRFAAPSVQNVQNAEMEELPYQYAPMRSCNRCSLNTNYRKCVECTLGPNYRSENPQTVVSRLYDEVLMRSLDAYRTVTLPEYWTIVCATPLYYNGIYKSAVKFIGDHADEWSCATHPENFGRSTADLMQRITAPPNQNYPTNVGGQQTPFQQPVYGQWQPPVMFQQQSLPFPGFQQQQQPIRYTNMALQVPPGTLPPEHIAHLQQSLPSGSYRYDPETKTITPCPWPAGTAPKEPQQRQINPLLANLPPLTRKPSVNQQSSLELLRVQPVPRKKAANWNVRATREKPTPYKPDASVLLMPERQTHPQRIRRDIDVIRRDLDQYIDRVVSVIGTVNADQRTEIGKAIIDTLDLLHTSLGTICVFAIQLICIRSICFDKWKCGDMKRRGVMDCVARWIFPSLRKNSSKSP
ncbi:uncharacterized protein LOC129590107 isoform X3 [Paramacrobiotus metropolitanus]|uniref:uncharacterized protein LOC129590107 isoform X3 n=1 Tax=Paramacrobiotus metropolitanus TaxID=2943436 RepID=UPI0024461259|nr:uncharacterized protein LOC129590107 isoform X3 [Paramacrobiotus metropolitanus]